MSRRNAREAALLTLFQMDFAADGDMPRDVSELAVDTVGDLKKKRSSLFAGARRRNVCRARRY